MNNNNNKDCNYLFKNLTLEELISKMPRLKHYIENRERLNFLIAKNKVSVMSANELNALDELRIYCEGIESMFN